VQPAGTRSLITGAARPWHPPQGAALHTPHHLPQKNVPVALACSTTATRSCQANRTKTTTVRLLIIPIRSTRCTDGWEIPTEVSWAGTSWRRCGGDQQIFSALASSELSTNASARRTTGPTTTSATSRVSRETNRARWPKAIHQRSMAARANISAALAARFSMPNAKPSRLAV